MNKNDLKYAIEDVVGTLIGILLVLVIIILICVVAAPDVEAGEVSQPSMAVSDIKQQGKEQHPHSFIHSAALLLGVYGQELDDTRLIETIGVLDSFCYSSQDAALLLNRHLPVEYTAVDISGNKLNTLPAPCLIWLTAELETDTPYTYCMVFLGADEAQVYVFDPIVGERVFPFSKANMTYNVLGKRAVYITERERQDMKLQMFDHVSGNFIRPTDNSLKDCDLDGVNQEPEPLELDENGLPVGWNAPEAGDE